MIPFFNIPKIKRQVDQADSIRFFPQIQDTDQERLDFILKTMREMKIGPILSRDLIKHPILEPLSTDWQKNPNAFFSYTSPVEPFDRLDHFFFQFTRDSSGENMIRVWEFGGKSRYNWQRKSSAYNDTFEKYFDRVLSQLKSGGSLGDSSTERLGEMLYQIQWPDYTRNETFGSVTSKIVYQPIFNPTYQKLVVPFKDSDENFAISNFDIMFPLLLTYDEFIGAEEASRSYSLRDGKGQSTKFLFYTPTQFYLVRPYYIIREYTETKMLKQLRNYEDLQARINLGEFIISDIAYDWLNVTNLNKKTFYLLGLNPSTLSSLPTWVTNAFGRTILPNL